MKSLHEGWHSWSIKCHTHVRCHPAAATIQIPKDCRPLSRSRRLQLGAQVSPPGLPLYRGGVRREGHIHRIHRPLQRSRVLRRHALQRSPPLPPPRTADICQPRRLQLHITTTPMLCWFQQGFKSIFKTTMQALHPPRKFGPSAKASVHANVVSDKPYLRKRHPAPV